jgi:hypothetical protein
MPNHYKILSVSFKLGLVVALGYILLITTYQIGQGVDRCLDLGHGYVICDLPGHLYYWPPGQPLSMFGLLNQDIVGLLATDRWIIGKTREYWFAVDKKNHCVYYPVSCEKEVMEIEKYLFAVDEKGRHVYYPLDSEKEVKEIAGLDFLPSELMMKFPPISFWWPSPYEYKFKTTTSLVCKVGAGYVIIVMLVAMVHHTYRRRQKIKSKTATS